MIRVLFICVGNACRSPMAEGFANHYGGGYLTAYGAGSKPAGVVMPDTIEVMREKGIDISHQRSKPISEINLLLMDCIIILDETLADLIRPGSLEAEILHWFVPDPVGQSLEVYRNVRDQLEPKVLELVKLIQSSA